jgi:hypothetical protein
MAKDAPDPRADTPAKEPSSEVIDWNKVRGEVLRDIFRSELLKQSSERLARELGELWRDDRS